MGTLHSYVGPLRPCYSGGGAERVDGGHSDLLNKWRQRKHQTREPELDSKFSLDEGWPDRQQLRHVHSVRGMLGDGGKDRGDTAHCKVITITD